MRNILLGLLALGAISTANAAVLLPCPDLVHYQALQINFLYNAPSGFTGSKRVLTAAEMHGVVNSMLGHLDRDTIDRIDPVYDNTTGNLQISMCVRK